jgi:mannitol operon transcriptional antiterminator
MDQRTQEILRILINDGKHHTFKDIAQKINTSVRTVARNMKEVYAFCKAYNVNIKHKRGVGVSIELDHVRKSELIDRLNHTNDKEPFSPTDRMAVMIAELLTANEPIKSYYFASNLRVASGTISRDLIEIKKWFEKNELVLYITRGNGIELNGNADFILQAKVNLLITHINTKYFYYLNDESDFLEIFAMNLSFYTKEKLADLLNFHFLLKVIHVIDEYDPSLKKRLADLYYIRFVILITLIIEKMEAQPEENDIYPSKVMDKKETFEYIKELIRLINNELEVKMTNKDIVTIYNNFVSSKVRHPYPIDKGSLDNRTMKITLKLIELIQNDLNIQLIEDQDLLERLNLHLKLMLMRKEMKIKVTENIIDHIKNDYEFVFSIVKKHLGNIFFGTNVLDDEEVSFITLHFAASIMRIRSRAQIIKAVVVCMSGIGTSYMLVERIRGRYSSIEIADTLSVHDVNEFYLMNQGIDLIISTVYLETLLLPAVIIDPLLSADDEKEISSQLVLLKERKAQNMNLNFEETGKKEDSQSDYHNSNSIVFYFGLINQLLNEFIFESNLTVQNMQELLEYVSKLPTPLKQAQGKVLNELMKRETYGSTFIDDAGLLLLHCKAEQVTCLGVVRLQHPTELKVGDTIQQVKAALIMIVPEHPDQRIVNLFGTISKQIIADHEFLMTLIESPKDRVLDKIGSIFSQFISVS